MIKQGLIFYLLATTFALAANAEIKSQVVNYSDGDTELQGHIYWDTAVAGKRPAILVVHEWWGLNEYAQQRAKMLARRGFVAFAADMYSKGKLTDHPKEAGEWATAIRSNVDLWQRRANLALAQLRAHPEVDQTRLAAIGYCFGGSTVMQLAYSGADIKGIVSFHGSLPPATDEQGQQIKAKILVAHGAVDPFIPAERIAAFQAALEKAGADWQMIYYAGAQHSFTDPAADAHGLDGAAYNANADRRSWGTMQAFFREIFH